MTTHDTIEMRMPVWLVLSELFLDTELKATDHTRIARECVQSPYSTEQLTGILENELYPALIGNLFVMSGGEWAGFGEEWVREVVGPRLGRRRKLPFPPLMRWMYRSDWDRIKTLIEEMRTESNKSVDHCNSPGANAG